MFHAAVTCSWRRWVAGHPQAGPAAVTCLYRYTLFSLLGTAPLRESSGLLECDCLFYWDDHQWLTMVITLHMDPHVSTCKHNFSFQFCFHKHLTALRTSLLLLDQSRPCGSSSFETWLICMATKTSSLRLCYLAACFATFSYYGWTATSEPSPYPKEGYRSEYIVYVR